MLKTITIEVKMLITDEDAAISEAEDDIIEGLSILDSRGELTYTECYSTKIKEVRETTEDEKEMFWDSL